MLRKFQYLAKRNFPIKKARACVLIVVRERNFYFLLFDVELSSLCLPYVIT